MSDGSAEGGRDASRNPVNKKSGGDDFVQALAKIAVAQVFDSIGFQGFHQSSLNVMSDVAVRYVSNIGEISNLNANLAGRNYCELLDVVHALKELGSVQGFSGGSDVNHCHANSGIIRDLIHYVDDAGEPPFAYSIPQFPVSKEQKIDSSFMQLGETPPYKHIPAWLPAFPVVSERSVADTKVEAVVDHARKQKNPDSSFLDLQQMLASNGSELPIPVDAAKEKRVAESNPFVAAPLQSEEKEQVCPVLPPPRMMEQVCPVLPPPRMMEQDTAYTGHNHYSVYDNVFVPVTEAEKETPKHESEEQETEKHIFQSPKRSLIRFKLGINKKKPGSLKNVKHQQSNGDMISCSEHPEKKKKGFIDSEELAQL